MKKYITILLLLFVFNANSQDCKMWVGQPTDSINAIISATEAYLHCSFLGKENINFKRSSFDIDLNDSSGSNSIYIRVDNVIDKIVITSSSYKQRETLYKYLKGLAKRCANYQFKQYPFEDIFFNKGSRLYPKGMNIYIVK